MAVDDDLLGLFADVVVDVLLGLSVVLHELGQEADVANGQTERVHLGQPFLVGQRGDVGPQALEGIVDALHPPALPHVSCLAPSKAQRDLLDTFSFSVALRPQRP